MTEVLVLKLEEDDDQNANWIVVDSSGARIGPPVTGPLDAARVDVGERNVIVLIPATGVLTTTIDLPLKSASRIQQALPFALEEFLADDVENLHFAAGARRENGRIPVAVIEHEKLAGLLERLMDAGIQPTELMAENYGLASIPGTISILLSDEQIIINDGADTELVMQGVGPADALAAIGAIDDNVETDDESATAPGTMPKHVLVYCEAGTEETYSHDFIALRHDFDSVDVKLLPDGVLPRLAVTVATGTGVNLLQGEFGARTEYGNVLRPWKIAAALLLAFGVLGIAGKAIDYVQLSQREAMLREQFITEYGQIAPGTEDVRDPLAVIASLRARTGAGGDQPTVFLRSLEELSRALSDNAGADIQAINYRAGIVDIRLSAPNVGVLDNIRREIDEGGQYEAEIQSAEQDGDKVASRIQIQPMTR